jgi:hypothetical protein
MPLIEEVLRDGRRGLRYNLHRGQQRAWDSAKETVAIIAGVRSGKTSFGPLWLHREMMRKGPLDYLAVAPTFHLLDAGARPEIEALFGGMLQLGWGTQRQFTISEDGHRRLWPGRPIERTRRIIYGHAQNPESLAALRAGAAWADEAGQKQFRLGSWDEVERRVSFDSGRKLITTTVYDLGWIKQRLYDPWTQHGRDHPSVEVVNFRTIDNPAFPQEKYYEAMRSYPTWKFRMFYDGVFTRPAGLIYDCFDPTNHVQAARVVPSEWTRYAGIDFGAVNTAAVFLAQERNPATRQPTGRFLLYREYPDREGCLPGKYAAPTHARRLLKPEAMVPTFVGGAASEDEWRGKFRAAGVPVLEPPISSVEPQIESVYAMLSQGKLLIASDCVGALDQLASYSRELDDDGEPTEKIDNDAAYHYLAALRYVCSWICRGGMAGYTVSPSRERSAAESLPPGVFGQDGGRDSGDELPEPHGRVSAGSWSGAGMNFPQF